MNRKLMVFVVALLALGALEFGLLGASASGIVGGASRPLPPIGQRSNVQISTATATDTPPPTATRTPPPNPGCGVSPPATSPPCSAIPTSIELKRPNPAAIFCDGGSPSVLRVFVRSDEGGPVDDGTPVYFSVFNGSAAPSYVRTVGGAASTAIVIYSDAYSATPNVIVQSGDLQTAIRVRCKPNSNCAVSPPPNSPPCAPTPRPCNPSPGADINSPPCAVVTPISPPMCAPGQTSPPCTPPTATPNPCNPSPGADLNSPPCAVETPFSPPTCELGQTSPPCTPPTPTVGPVPNPCLERGTSPTPVPCPNEMRLDADPETDGIQTFLRVSVDQPFRVGLDVTKIGPSNYQGYGWLISFADAELSFLSRTENTAATQLPACAATPNVGYEPGISRIYSGCYTTNPDGVNFVGEITTLELQCRTAGSFALRLLDVVDDPGFGSGLIDHNGLVLSTGTFDITVECNGIASCVSFDPGACDPSATPTPPGPDAQTATAIAIRTATAIAGPPNPPTNTPTAIATATPVPTSTATARPTGAVCADVTGDGRVTARDVSAIAAHIFGRYQPRYDLNDDGRVNQQDVKIASAQLGRRC